MVFSLETSLFHRLWTCSAISDYWDRVLTFIFGVTNYQPPKDPLLLLFGCTKTCNLSDELKTLKLQNNHQWTLICLLVTRRNIFKHCISATMPTSRETLKHFYLEKNWTLQCKKSAILNALNPDGVPSLTTA